VDLVLMRADSRLADELGGEPGWHEVYRDHLAVLLQKSGAAPPQSAKED
jgi:hypothetical protein